jgi:hypothetical protein
MTAYANRRLTLGRRDAETRTAERPAKSWVRQATVMWVHRIVSDPVVLPAWQLRFVQKV